MWYHLLMNDLEYLAIYSTRMEAEGIEKLLENNGVKCFLQFSETGDVLEGVGVGTGPTEIYVAPEQLKKAREIAGLESKEERM